MKGMNLNVDAEPDSEDELYENPVDVIKEIGNHPLMQKAQNALIEQLKETQYRLGIELIDKKTELKYQVQDREVIGVQLYSLQQQLARLQISLENSHNEYNALVEKRLQEEDMLKRVEENNSEQLARLKDHQKQHKNYISELDSLTETLRQIDTYNQEVESEIAITRRATYKAEQSITSLEKYKESQDAYVDNLNKQVKQLKEQILLNVGQIESQKSETIEALKVVEDTVKELEVIASEKKQLIIQWKSALSGLSRRDEALSQASAALANAESAVHDYDVEIDAAKRNQQKEQAKHESLVNVRDRLESELQWVEESLNNIKIERDMLQERFTLLSKSNQQTIAEVKRVELISKQLVTDADATLQNLQVVTLERQRLEEELVLSMSTSSNVNKAVVNLNKEQEKMVQKIHKLENEGTEIENEIARTKLDNLNSSSLLDQLSERLAGCQKELHDKEQLIEKYSIEIRQRTDEIEKKMYRVDRLNKKYEKMIESAGGEENLGPLENTIRNLNKEIDAVNSECKELERDWLKKQTELVAVASEGDTLAEKNNESQARCTILTQQQLRLTKDLRVLQTDVKSAQQSNIDLQKDVSKLNVLISTNHDSEADLQNANYVLELGCIEELKDMEKDSVALQAQIAETKSSKDCMLDEILEEERQALLWEKKIQLEKETREALDPTVGQQETQNMEKEIHRMALRLDALKREQERLSSEMERAILKRTAISNRFEGKQRVQAAAAKSSSKANQDLSQVAVKKKIALLKKDARALAEETMRYSNSTDERKTQLSDMTVQLENITRQFTNNNDSCFQAQGLVNDLLYQKQLNQEQISYRQKYAKKLKELTAGSGIEMSQSMQVERKLLSSTQAIDNVKEIILSLTQTQPHLGDVLSRVLAMTGSGIAE